MFDDCLAAVKLLGKWLTQFINFFLMLATFDGQTFISCCLDYCNSLLHGISDSLLQRLQSVHHGTWRSDHITPVLRQLHWLPVRQRIYFKIADVL